MYSKQAYSSLIYNPQDRPRRPQTPLGVKSSNSFSQVNYNKSFSKNMPPSPHYSHNINNNLGSRQQVSKSRVSVNSSISQLQFLNADGGQIFPEDLIFLLKNEQKNINNFKQKIEKEKTRVENDFAILKTEIQHILEDLKLSFQAQLDLVYKTFITKYAQVKGEVQQIRRLRKEILIANNTSSTHMPIHKDSTSNSDIVSQIEKDAEHFRNYRVYSYLTEMQKQRINPILELCSEIILIGSADCPFYRSKEMSMKSKSVKSAFSNTLSDVFENIQDYIVSPEAIIQKQKLEEENANAILENIQNQYENFPKQAFGAHYPQNKPSPPKFDFEIPKKPSVRPPSHPKEQTSGKNSLGLKNRLTFSDSSEKVSVTRWADSVSLRKIQRVVTDHTDTILCMFFIDDKYIATGSKDKTINIYSFQGKKITTLRGHDASICTLSTIKNSNGQTFLASGSDHGCCCLILWDTKTWTISSRIQAHSAAVTCIVDLDDGEHLVTGSYDKQILLFNHWSGQILASHNNKSNVTSIVLTSDKKKLVSACLESSLLVWSIVRKNNDISIEVETTISNDSFVCILEASILRPEIVYGATRNGKIKVFNLNRDGRAQRTLTVNENSIIQLAVIEREMKPEAPLVFSCSSKDKSLCMTKLDSGLSQLIKINGVFNVEFGCGIGPKIIFSNKNSGILGILSQSSTAKQFSLFDIDLK